MNTIDILGDEETFRNILESEITEFEDNKIEIMGDYAFYGCDTIEEIEYLG